MDADLSTDLRDCWTARLGAPLRGTETWTIGTRLAKGARGVRGPKRESSGRAYKPAAGTWRCERASRTRSAASKDCRRSASRLMRDVRRRRRLSTTELLVSPSDAGCAFTGDVDWVGRSDSRVDTCDAWGGPARASSGMAAGGPIVRFEGRRRLDARLRTAIPGVRGAARGGRTQRGSPGVTAVENTGTAPAA